MKLKKTHFGPLFVQQVRCEISLQKNNCHQKSILGLYAAMTSGKKSEKFHALIFSQNLRTLFWAYFGPLLAQKLFHKMFF